MRTPDIVNRMLGRSVRDLADEVDQALGRLASAQGLEAQASDALALARADVATARQEVSTARDALFAQHPDLAPEGWNVNTNPRTQIPTPDEAVANPGAWDPDPVEVDDANDPRFTAGVSSVVPVSDDAELPPIVWGENDE